MLDPSPSVPKRARRSKTNWNKFLIVILLFAVSFFFTNIILYERLTSALSRAKGMHREVARHVRQSLRSAMKTGIEVGSEVLEASFLLPRPKLIRWSKLPKVEDLVPVEDVPRIALARERADKQQRKEVPKYMKQPSLEFAGAPPPPLKRRPQSNARPKQPPAHAHKAAAHAPETPRPAAAGQAGGLLPPARAAEQHAPQHSDAPRLSPQVLGSINVEGRLEPLLAKEVDVALNGILLEMKGSISCGGHLIMEFSSFEEVARASPDLASLVPESDLLSKKGWGSCAVVGNSGSVLQSAHGEEIDAHDTVVRFNRAPTRDFEQHVGSKTTIRVQNVDNLGYREKASDKVLIFSARSAKDMSKFVTHRQRHPQHPQLAFNPEFWCHTWDWVAHRKLKPTSGMAGVVMALKHCDHPVDLYGFSHNATKFHYYNSLPEKVTHKEIYTYHPFVEEAEIYRELAQLNLTRLFA
uniref:beta-galactoside alpha-(2,6)-sialyltransferase n=1 Tax=Tetraselmis sp. GSL018 TaxID=582737 RepID=A0A061S024_9CHLO|mmetsp:Transcript_42431/g.100701  ORF Transcript_42431/g.100701 Transcript_42431/m.100701 type:complete len:467 (+) Transcript_42431:185-1585(+)